MSSNLFCPNMVLKATALQLIKIKDEHYDKLIRELGQSKTGLLDLDDWKLQFSSSLKERHDDSNLHITKDELLKLVDWKLMKGKFRPTLKKLVSQNSEEDIKSIINQSFTIFLNSESKIKSKQSYTDLVKTSLQILVKLRGIGPATASLLLSLLCKITSRAPPFFSDEAAVLILRSSTKLKYNVKEYVEFVEWFYEVNDGFKRSNEDLEHGLWCVEMGRVLFNEEYLNKVDKDSKDDVQREFENKDEVKKDSTSIKRKPEDGDPEVKKDEFKGLRRSERAKRRRGES